MRFITALIFLGLAGPAFSQTMSSNPHMSAADDSLAAGMTKMNTAMSATPMTGDPDRDFAAMMIAHHQGAVEMCKSELQYGKDPQLRLLCRNIIAAQDNEIAEMKSWQQRHLVP